MNLTKLYKKLSRDQIDFITDAWNFRFGKTLTPSLFPFAEINTVIMALDMLIGELPRNEDWWIKGKKLIEQLSDFSKNDTLPKDFNLPKYRKLEKKRKKRK